MATPHHLAQIQHLLGKRRNPDANPLDLTARKKSREYLDSHKDVEKRRRDRINGCLETIRTLVPICHQLPTHRRVDKADVLDMTIIYLQMMNQFLEKIGVTDIFAATHQQISLFSSLEKWVREQSKNYADVSNFTRDILSHLEKEVQTASHVIASQQVTTSILLKSVETSNPHRSHDYIKQEGVVRPDADTAVNTNSSPSDDENRPNSRGESDCQSVGSEELVPRFGDQSSVGEREKICPNSLHMEKSLSPSAQPETTRRMATSSTSGCHINCKCHEASSVDKAVNTDHSMSGFAWPMSGPVTLPIISGQIVLHALPNTSGNISNLNAPVALHAEILSCSSLTDCHQKSDVTPQMGRPDDKKQCPTTPPSDTSVTGNKCVSSYCGHNEEEPKHIVKSEPLLNLQLNNTDKQPNIRCHCPSQSALPGGHGSWHGNESNTRFLTSLGHQYKNDSNGIGYARNGCCERLSNGTSLKLKSLMVHRHETQRCESR